MTARRRGTPRLLVPALLSFGLTGLGIVIAARMTSFQGFGTLAVAATVFFFNRGEY